jgi:hypothetical protein
MATRARGAEEGAERRAALEGRVERALGRVAAQAWRQAEAAFAARFEPRAGLERLRAWREGQPRPLDCLGHLPTIGRLVRGLERLDRYATGGQPNPGVGLRLLETWMDGYRAAAVDGEGPWPRHLGYFLPLLEAEARHAKHTHAPRIKDRRIAEGKRPPRRGRGKPGRGPAIGIDPKKIPTRQELDELRREHRRRRRRRGYDGRGQ